MLMGADRRRYDLPMKTSPMLAALALGALASVSALAQSYPTKPVRFIVPFAAGGATDLLTRLVAGELQNDLKQPFIVENRAGAGGNIGMEAIAKAAGDGYTLGIGAGATMSINPALNPSKTYDTTRDFAAIQVLVRIPHVLMVNKDFPPSNLSELVAWMKANPGKVSHGTPGSGTTSHLFGELFKKQMGVDMVHVPYKGGNLARQDLLGGTLQLAFSTLVEAQTLVQNGQTKGIAVISQGGRVPGLPNVPTFSELGVPRFDSENWFGVIGPDGIPRDILLALNKRIGALPAKSEYRARLAPTGLVPATPLSPEEFRGFIAADAKKWAAIIKELGVKPE
jgi:tripartite-type tricarboxylate transporter receptor subunit TctC